jgi:hypothetical protein
MAILETKDLRKIYGSRETKIELTAYDDLFQTDESREEAKCRL